MCAEVVFELSLCWCSVLNAVLRLLRQIGEVVDVPSLVLASSSFRAPLDGDCFIIVLGVEFVFGSIVTILLLRDIERSLFFVPWEANGVDELRSSVGLHFRSPRATLIVEKRLSFSAHQQGFYVL